MTPLTSAGQGAGYHRDVRARLDVRVLALLLVTAAAGCINRGAIYHVASGQPLTSAGGPVEGDDRLDEGRAESVVVIGVSRIFGLRVISGTDDGVSWHQQRWGSVAQARADDGFVAIKLRPRHGERRYAITAAVLAADDMEYYELDSASIPAFDAPRGRLTYLGGLDAEIYSENGNNLARLRDNPAITRQQAASFVARRYPQIAADLAAGRLEWLHMGEMRRK